MYRQFKLIKIYGYLWNNCKPETTKLNSDKPRMDLPRITCVCVSKNRPALLLRAIQLFKFQTYPNKDLVIVYEDATESLDHVVGDDEITFIRLQNASQLTLGERRNLSIQHCRGEYFCQWDDDDWYHNRRLELQLNALIESGRSACVLRRLILYDGITRKAYLSSERYWEGTLLCRTDLINDTIRYPNVNRSEDNSLVVSLVRRNHVHPLSAPYLYAYFFHGGNTWDQAHFNQLFEAGYALPDSANNVMKKIFTDDKFDQASDKVEQLDFDVL